MLERSRDRSRALFGLVVGAVVVLAGALGRLWPAERWDVPAIAVTCGLTLAALLAWALVRPRRGAWASLGLSPLAGLLGVAMILLAIADPRHQAELYPAALGAAGGATVIAAFVRWALASAAHLHPPLPLDDGARFSVTRPGEERASSRTARQIERGDRVEIGPGVLLPVDGVIEVGGGHADERLLTRSERGVAKGAEDPVLAGSKLDASALTITASSSARESLIARVDRRAKQLSERIAHAGEGVGGRVSAALGWLVSLSLVALSLVRGAGEGAARALPAVAGALLAVGVAAPAIARRRALARAISRATRSGVVPDRPDAFEALLSARRWQVDARLLAPTGEVELVGDPATVLPVALALLEGEAGPELEALRAELSRRELPPMVAAAVRRVGEVRHGTVAGERWCLGPAEPTLKEARVSMMRELELSVGFVEERSAVSWVLARPDREVAGAVGVRLFVEPEIAALARGLEATLAPVACERVSAALATAARLERGGSRLDAILLAAGSGAPERGLVVEVRPPTPEHSLSAPVSVFAPSVPKLIGLLASARSSRGRAARLGLLTALAPALVVLLLLAAGVLEPVLATLACTTGLAVAWLRS